MNRRSFLRGLIAACGGGCQLIMPVRGIIMPVDSADLLVRAYCDLVDLIQRPEPLDTPFWSWRVKGPNGWYVQPLPPLKPVDSA